MGIGDKRHPTLDEVIRRDLRDPEFGNPDRVVAKPRQRRDDPEHRIQAELIARVRLLERNNPDLCDLHAIPNGGHRGRAAAGKMKAEGVKRGVPDLFLPVPRDGRTHNPASPHDVHGRLYYGLYLETKTPAGRLTPEQRDFLTRAVGRGYACATYREPGEGVRRLLQYLRGEWRQEPGCIR